MMFTKPLTPKTYLQGFDVDDLIKVYFEFNQLKVLFRQGWIKHGLAQEVCESVAEHTLGVVFLSMLLVDRYFPDLDLLKVLRMSILHDFGEVHAGDFTPLDAVSSGEKHTLEKESFTKIFSQTSDAALYCRIWEEFEEGQISEARFVRQVDRLEMALQAAVYQFEKLPEPQEFFDSARISIHEHELLILLDELEALGKSDTG
jgi:putative hydrolase of HD superfamily